ncbi:nitrate- and nitrite sensing domain-containing protein [Streptomyces sp. URMC 123]|uniref:sensor histidine kinase n=1 Tax=Streptomyces sp. URMC 123 TaxID=3423403 RepID=UPI003F1941D7
MRGRLVASVAVVAMAVTAGGAPAIVDAARDLNDTQDLVGLAELSGRTTALAHALADERDAMTEYVAAGRAAGSTAAAGAESRRARVDRQAAELRPDAPASLRELIDSLPEIRRRALTGPGTPLETFQAYTHAVQALRATSAELARTLPERAPGGPAEALPALGRAVERASATRALLLGALAEGGPAPELTAAAQRTRLQEQSALGDFEEIAPRDARDAYHRTVGGAESTSAERHLDRLTDQPQLSGSDLTVDRARLAQILSGRIDRMRAVDSSLTAAEGTRAAELRDDAVTALELRIALVVLCLLVAVGVSTSAARSLTRPLAVLRRGARRVAADPVEEGPIVFSGRQDEFADTVAAVNEVHEAAVRFHERAERLCGERRDLAHERERLLAQRSELLRRQEALRAELAGRQDAARAGFVDLALRGIALTERQIDVIEGLERDETDPDRLQTLFELDHLATRTRRYGHNLLVLAGAGNGADGAAPVPLLDVARAAVSEIERYGRVRIESLPPGTGVVGEAADALSHLVAELLDNATAFSPPTADVRLAGRLLESGEIVLGVLDEGLGMTENRLAEINARLAAAGTDGGPDAGPEAQPGRGADVLGLGLHVVARLAARHGFQVRLRQRKRGGTAATVVIPTRLLAPVDTEGGGAVAAPRPEPAGEHARTSADERLPTRADAVAGAGLAPAYGADAAPGAGAAVPSDAPGWADAVVRPEVPAERDVPTGFVVPVGPDVAAGPGALAGPDAAVRPGMPVRERAEGRRLPRRTPRQAVAGATPPGEGAAPRERTTGSVDAEELRRRLGGFQRGSRDGRRAAETEFAGRAEPGRERAEGGRAEEGHGRERRADAGPGARGGGDGTGDTGEQPKGAPAEGDTTRGTAGGGQGDTVEEARG